MIDQNDPPLAPPTIPLKNGLMIAWRRECYRSTASARTFQIPLVLIPGSKSSGKLAKLLGYFSCAARTVKELGTRRPTTVVCINLPPFLPLICYLYALVSGARVVLDFHSGAATNPTWRPFLPLYRHLVRKGPFTLCHNRFDGALVSSWGGTPVHLIALPQTSFANVHYSPRGERPLFFFVCSFAPDEPVLLTVEAMRQSPDCDFVISGNYRKHGINPADMPPNVKLAGFMDYRDYLDTMSHSTAIITLSDRPNIMQMAVHEALTIGVPVITNNSQTLREVLGKAGHFVDIDTTSLTAAFVDVATHAAQMHAEAIVAKHRAWATSEHELKPIRQGEAAHLFLRDVQPAQTVPS